MRHKQKEFRILHRMWQIHDLWTLCLEVIADQQYPYGKCVLKNLKMIQTTGLVNWLELQVKRWRCRALPENLNSWYQVTCSKCGFAVNNYLADL